MFYLELYRNHKENVANISVPKVLNQRSDEILEITLDKIRREFFEIKNNKSRGTDKTSIESIKLGEKLLQGLQDLLKSNYYINAPKKVNTTNLGNYRIISLLLTYV